MHLFLPETDWIWERQLCLARAILNGLLNNDGKCLDTVSLQTLMAECGAILDSHSLTVDIIDVDSPATLVPANITMKPKVILPPPGVIGRPDIFSNWRWRRIQHMGNNFEQDWKNNFCVKNFCVDVM